MKTHVKVVTHFITLFHIFIRVQAFIIIIIMCAQIFKNGINYFRFIFLNCNPFFFSKAIILLIIKQYK